MAGRPTSYKPEYCDMLVTHMEQGLSFESFAGFLKVARSTIYEWLDNNPDFSDAKKDGTERNRWFWEKVSVDALTQQINPTVLIFNLKNRFPGEWRDKREIDNNLGINKESAIAIELAKELISLKKR